MWGQAEKGVLLSNWKNEDLVGSSAYNNTYNEVWGLAVNDAEYAIIGSTAGTHFINVTDPENPVEDFFVQGVSFGPHIIHRDYHDYKGYLYSIADEQIGTLKSKLQIIDVSNLPEKVEVVYVDDDRIERAHNLFIDTSQARLYVFAAKGGDDPYSAIRAYDISEPLNPVQLGDFRTGIDGVSVGHYHDGFIRDHIAYLNAGYDGLVIADMEDPENLKVLSHLRSSDYPESGYNHSGWLSDDGQYYYMADETWGTDIKVFDVSDPRNITYISKFDAGNNSPYSIPHNQIVRCNYLVTSYYYDGLQVYDLSDPGRPKRILYYPTSDISPRENYEGAWGVYPFLPSGNILVSDMQNGLFVISGFSDYCKSVATEEINSSKLKITPNPTGGFFRIWSETALKKVNIYSADGRLVNSLDIHNSNTKNLEINQPGVYFAEIFTLEGKQVEKIIVQQ